MAASGTATNRTNIELDPETSALIIQKAQENSAIMSLAQKIPLPGKGLTIPVIASDPEAEWVAETGLKPVKNPGLSKKIMQAYKLAVIVPFSDEFRRDMAALTQQIINRLPGARAKNLMPRSSMEMLRDLTLIHSHQYRHRAWEQMRIRHW